jgi:hypothetical protein
LESLDSHLLAAWVRISTPTRPACASCHLACPSRASHCAECGHCALHPDHHCEEIGNCIGHQNLKPFILGFCYSFLSGVAKSPLAFARFTANVNKATNIPIIVQ